MAVHLALQPATRRGVLCGVRTVDTGSTQTETRLSKFERRAQPAGGSRGVPALLALGAAFEKLGAGKASQGGNRRPRRCPAGARLSPSATQLCPSSWCRSYRQPQTLPSIWKGWALSQARLDCKADWSAATFAEAPATLSSALPAVISSYPLWALSHPAKKIKAQQEQKQVSQVLRVMNSLYSELV